LKLGIDIRYVNAKLGIYFWQITTKLGNHFRHLKTKISIYFRKDKNAKFAICLRSNKQQAWHLFSALISSPLAREPGPHERTWATRRAPAPGERRKEGPVHSIGVTKPFWILLTKTQGILLSTGIIFPSWNSGTVLMTGTTADRVRGGLLPD
jgi:hypothetical protein